MRSFYFVSFLCLALLSVPALGADRSERVKAYTSEFVSRGFEGLPHLSGAIEDVLMRLPDEVFDNVADREEPVLFTEYFDKGKARLANSASVRVLPEDPPTFTRGFYLIKLSGELEKYPTAAKAVIAHEIAHRVTQYAHSKQADELEKAVNRLIRRWGFGRELQEARKALSGGV